MSTAISFYSGEIAMGSHLSIVAPTPLPTIGTPLIAQNADGGFIPNSTALGHSLFKDVSKAWFVQSGNIPAANPKLFMKRLGRHMFGRSGDDSFQPLTDYELQGFRWKDQLDRMYREDIKYPYVDYGEAIHAYADLNNGRAKDVGQFLDVADVCISALSRYLDYGGTDIRGCFALPLIQFLVGAIKIQRPNQSLDGIISIQDAFESSLNISADKLPEDLQPVNALHHFSVELGEFAGDANILQAVRMVRQNPAEAKELLEDGLHYYVEGQQVLPSEHGEEINPLSGYCHTDTELRLDDDPEAIGKRLFEKIYSTEEAIEVLS